MKLKKIKKPKKITLLNSVKNIDLFKNIKIPKLKKVKEPKFKNYF